MKAIFIPRNFDGSELENLNRDLMDVRDIYREFQFETGVLLIADNVSREEKLRKLGKVFDSDLKQSAPTTSNGINGI